MYGIPIGDLPPEIQDQLKAQYDRYKMESEDRANLMIDFFENLNVDQYRALDMIFEDILASPSSRARASWYLGYISGKHEEKFEGQCLVHGVNHKEQRMAAMLNSESVPEAKWDGEETDVEADNLRRRQMIEYRLIEVNGQLKCVDCGQDYVSIEDRMVKTPDDCDGCRQKAKWG